MAGDFFERQRRARTQTLWLRVVFALALVFSSILVAVGVALLLVMMGLGSLVISERSGTVVTAFSRGGAGWWIAAGVLGYSLLVAARTAWGLRGDGASLARSLRARPIDAGTDDPAERRLVNVVAEMALASAMPAPRIWLLDREESINAFATGTSAEGAIIGVTAGALRHLDRDELQAVMGHEFSHILNGDMALNTRLVAWLSGLFAIETMARALKERQRNSDKRWWLLFWGWHVGLWILHACGCIGLFIGRALQAAICRQREMLADASAVQFTRNGDSLKSALLKIDAVNGTRPLNAIAAAGMAHMFLVRSDSGAEGWLAQLREAVLRTHPAMIERVQALDRGMSEAQYRAAVRIARKEYLGARERAAAPVEMGGESLRPAAQPLRQLVPDLACSRLTGAQQDAVLALRARLGAGIEDLQAVFVAAMLEPDPARARRQLLALAPVLGAAVASRVPAALRELAALAPIARYPLLEGLLSPLAALPDQARLRLVRVARAFAARVAPLDAFRFATIRLLLRHLVQTSGVGAVSAPPGTAPEAAGMDAHARPAASLCAVLASCGSGEDEITRAYELGLDGLLTPRARPSLRSVPVDAGAIDQALQDLAALPYVHRAALGAALLRVVGANGTLGAREFDLLRALCGGLGIPVPGTGRIRREPATGLARVAAGG